MVKSKDAIDRPTEATGKICGNSPLPLLYGVGRGGFSLSLPPLKAKFKQSLSTSYPQTEQKPKILDREKMKGGDKTMAITKKALENPNDGYFERVYEMLDDLEKNEAVKNEPSPKEADRKKERPN